MAINTNQKGEAGSKITDNLLWLSICVLVFAEDVKIQWRNDKLIFPIGEIVNSLIFYSLDLIMHF